MAEDEGGQPVEMARFFDERVDTYEDHMWGLGQDIPEFYRRVGEEVDETAEPVRILDLGCGTGLELEGVLRRAPNAPITGIDLSRGMLAELRRKYGEHAAQIRLLCGSYEGCLWPARDYQYVVSVMSMHHLTYRRKSALYAAIGRALAAGGKYIEGDYVVGRWEERQYLREYRRKLARFGLAAAPASYHIDIPFAIATQIRLLEGAGFAAVKLVWEGENKAILVASA